MRIAATPGQDNTRRYLCVVVFTLVLRAIALALLWHTPYTSDANDYVTAAHRLLAGDHFTPYWPPGLPLFLEPFLAAGLSSGMLRAPMLLWWVLACWALYRLAVALNVQKYAWLLLLVFGTMPASIHLSLEPLTQLPVAALLLTALAATLAPPTLADAALLGASAGFMVLVRPGTLPFLVLLPLVFAVRRRRLVEPAFALLLGLVILTGWMLHAHRISGAWVLNTANAQNVWDGNNPWTPLYRTWFFGSHAKPGSDEINAFPQFRDIVTYGQTLPPTQQPSYFGQLTRTYVLHHPFLTLLRTANRIRAYWGFDTFTSANLRAAHSPWARISLPLEFGLYTLLIAPAFFSIAAATRSFWSRLDTWLLLGSIALYALPYWLSMSHPTYHYPVLALTALLGVMAWKAGTPHRTRGWIAVAIFTAIQMEWVFMMLGSRS